MKIEDEIMDFGEWILPTKWEDITLEQWSKIQELYGESEDKELDLTELIHILANKPKPYYQLFLFRHALGDKHRRQRICIRKRDTLSPLLSWNI